MTSTELYIPPNSISLDKLEMPQIRLGLQGFPKTGKTWSALTFPNPIVADLDRGLGAHRGRTDVIQVPLYDPEFGKKYYTTDPSNVKEVSMAWLLKEGKNLKANQTLIWDGLSGLESAYHSDWKKNPVTSTRSGQVDAFAEWANKLVYFGELCDELIKLKCGVILISHEAEKKDKSGEYTGKIRPLINGSFGDKIVGKFTDWFRQHAANKPDFTKDLSEMTRKNITNNWGMTVEQFKAMCDTFPRNTIYYWQLENDDNFDGGCSSLVNFPRYIPANYESFCKYMRKL